MTDGVIRQIRQLMSQTGSRTSMDVAAQDALRERVNQILKADPDHPLKNLVDPATGSLWKAGGPGMSKPDSPLFGVPKVYDRPTVDASHMHAGLGDQAQFGLEFSEDNRWTGLQGGENQDIGMVRSFVDVVGPRGESIPIEVTTLEHLERQNLVTAGTLASATPSEGWRAQDLLPADKFAELQAELPGTQEDRYNALQQMVFDRSLGTPPSATPPETLPETSPETPAATPLATPESQGLVPTGPLDVRPDGTTVHDPNLFEPVVSPGPPVEEPPPSQLPDTPPGTPSDTQPGGEGGEGGAGAESVTGAGEPDDTSAGPGAPGDASAGPGAPGDASAGPGAPGDASAGPGAPGDASAGPGAPGDASAGPGAPGDASAGPGAPGDASAGPGDASAGPGAPGDASAGPGDASAGPGAPGDASAGPGDASAGPGDASLVRVRWVTRRRVQVRPVVRVRRVTRRQVQVRPVVRRRVRVRPVPPSSLLLVPAVAVRVVPVRAVSAVPALVVPALVVPARWSWPWWSWSWWSWSWWSWSGSRPWWSWSGPWSGSGWSWSGVPVVPGPGGPGPGGPGWSWSGWSWSGWSWSG